ncbi:MAG: hypothetical protein C5B52_15245 [Bacteroidetes bacterium]|nr:MAG: hypothetical protein C5B52_15245 [Bacteroidota bacterium]
MMNVSDGNPSDLQNQFYSLLICPASLSPLKLSVFTYRTRNFGEQILQIPWEGILYAEKDWFYPVIDGVPRLIIESFLDYEDFFKSKMEDYHEKKKKILSKHGDFIKTIIKKNTRTKKSFELEWGLFDYKEDKTWDAPSDALLGRFLEETNETRESLNGKIIFDAGCGNGQLNSSIARCGALVIGVDLSKSVVRAFQNNDHPGAFFIQGDIQYPPLKRRCFDLVHSSGVLIHTTNTKFSFECIEKCVNDGGKLSVWLYHPRKNSIHKFFNFVRGFTSKLPLRFQYYLYKFTLFPVSYVVKRSKGNKQSAREMMIDILDWFTPEFRWEHSESEVTIWYEEKFYKKISVTTKSLFGFSIIGTRIDSGT